MKKFNHAIRLSNLPIELSDIPIELMDNGLDLAFLYIWLRTLTKRKKLSHVMVGVYFFKQLFIMLIKSKKMQQTNTCLKLEEKYYKDLEMLHEQYDVYLHDMKHTMRTIAELSEEGNCEEICKITEKMGTTLGSINEQIICSHKILNALFNERKVYAADKGVNLELEISEPLYLQEIDDLDLITLIGNLLDNAIEAEANSHRQKGILCNMHMARNTRHIIIQIENSYTEIRRKNLESSTVQKNIQGNIDNRKINLQANIDSLQLKMKSIGAKHGIGVKSVNGIIKKYGGIIETNKNEGRYKVKVILPVQYEWKEEVSYTEPLPAYLRSAYK